ncbi:M56 family metallopeptidase, partial [Streptomyces sp. NPDC002596]
LAAAAGPVPRRVAALLGRAGRPPGVGRAAAAALLACLILSGAAALEATNDLHSSIEVAQGEVPQR